MLAGFAFCFHVKLKSFDLSFLGSVPPPPPGGPPPQGGAGGPPGGPPGGVPDGGLSGLGSGQVCPGPVGGGIEVSGIRTVGFSAIFS